ncbi:transmembrane protein 186-like [Rattus norvegicus]|uniref:transmembrane protein 186-like n=1 Tax=Rattus norvegicus TaxID=10116 RepID=UPI002FD815EA
MLNPCNTFCALSSTPPSAWRRPLQQLWCRTGQGDSVRWVGRSQQAQRLKKIHTIYRFNAIRALGFLSRLKLAQMAVTVMASPPGFYCYSQGLMTLSSLGLMSGIARFALVMLCWMSHFFWRLMGILYVNESGTLLRVAHLTFWGWRQDTYCAVSDMMPLLESEEQVQDEFLGIQQYSGKQTFYLTLRYGRILERDRFSQVFRTLATLKNSK